MLLDLVLGDADGLDLLRRMKQEAPDTKVILISAHGSIESAVTAMKLGGYDFIKKPFELEEIVAAVGNARAHQPPRAAGRLPGRAGAAAQRRRTFVHAAPEMMRLLAEVEVIAKSPVPLVLVTGESGTGKQAIARMLHEGSARAAGPFVELNCSAIPENLVESELFGHERGAFSDARERKLGLVEIADGGTLFLDEIGDLGAGAQAKLLTFLEQRTFRRVGATAVRRVDARVVAATNRDLPAAVAAPHLPRGSLLPGQRHHRAPAARCASGSPTCASLAEHFLAESAREFGRRFQGIAAETAGLLERYRWPGNVRELRAVIARAALLHDDTALRPAHLPAELIWPRRWPRRRSRPSGRPGRPSRRHPHARGGRAGPHPPRAGDLRRQPHAGRPAPRHHAPDPRQEDRQRRRHRRVIGWLLRQRPSTAAATAPEDARGQHPPQRGQPDDVGAGVDASLPLMWPRWVSTVLMLIPRRPAICLFELPQTTRSKICRSRCDSRSMLREAPFRSPRPGAPAAGTAIPAATPAPRARRPRSRR